MTKIAYWDCSQCGKRVSQAPRHKKLRVRRELLSVQADCAHGPGWDHARCHPVLGHPEIEIHAARRERRTVAGLMQ